QAVIGADVNQSFFLWRFSERGCIAKESGGLILRDCVQAPNFAHYRQLVAIETARKLAADDLPTVAAIVAAKKFVGSEIDARVRMRTDDERRVPIPSQRIFIAANLRLNTQPFTRAFVTANQVAILEFGIDRIRIFRINLSAKTVSALRNPPVAVD